MMGYPVQEWVFAGAIVLIVAHLWSISNKLDRVLRRLNEAEYRRITGNSN